MGADTIPCKQNGSLIKPIVDKFDYKFLELENGLKCLLISDAEADKAAACLNVGRV